MRKIFFTGKPGSKENPFLQIHICFPIIGMMMLIFIFDSTFCYSLAGGDGKESSFEFSDVKKAAKILADTDFKDSAGQVPEFLRGIGYDQWRDIRFKPAKSLWRNANLRFEVQFFHPGNYYDRTVVIHIVDSTGIRPIPFNKADFDYGSNDFADQVTQNVGFAGFRIHYPINSPDYKDEIIVFLGASYFRALGKNQQYGLSARGLTIDTGLESGEEFPYFKEFWIVKPAPQADHIVVYALLDSPRMTGAYAYVIRPGKATIVSVESVLFSRSNVQKLGIAPLTSMFFYGENQNLRPGDDFRPEIHDSDGLLVELASGEWIWRPLSNPSVLSFNDYEAPNPRGFGLLQRDMDFNNYQDLEALYHKRPSVWVTPKNKWGNGKIELISIPTTTEYNDNIIAAWIPEMPANQTNTSAFAYDMRWYLPEKTPHGGGYVASTRTAFEKDKQERLFMIDFSGGRLDSLHAAIEPAFVVSVNEDERVQLIQNIIQENPFINGWRLTIKLRDKGENVLKRALPMKSPPIRLRAFLKHKDDILTETWDYDFHP